MTCYTGLDWVKEARLEHLPTLRDPRIHVIMTGRPLRSALLCAPQRGEMRNLQDLTRDFPAVENALRRWWEWLPREKSWMVGWQEFRWLNRLCYEELAPNLVREYAGLADAAAALDWHYSCQLQDEKVMNHALFEHAMLELADNFTMSADPNEYAKFLDDLFERIKRRCADEAARRHVRLERRPPEQEAGKITSPEKLLLDQRQFEWIQSEVTKPEKANDAILFGKEAPRASKPYVGKKQGSDPLMRAWPGGAKKFEAWEDGLHNKMKEANATLNTRFLQANPHVSQFRGPARTENPLPYTIFLGQAEAAIKYRFEIDPQIIDLSATQRQIDLQVCAVTTPDSRTHMSSSVQRPHSSQDRRSPAMHQKIRPSSHTFTRQVDRPVSAAGRRRQIGAGRIEYGQNVQSSSMNKLSASILPLQNSLATRPCSAMSMPQSQDGWAHDDCSPAPSQQNSRPRTSLGHREDLRQPLTEKLGSVYRSESMTRSRRRLGNIANVESMYEIERSLSLGSSPCEAQLFDVATSCISKFDTFSTLVPEVSLLSLIQPISANISVRVERTNRAASRIRPQHLGNTLFVKSVSPHGEKSPQHGEKSPKYEKPASCPIADSPNTPSSIKSAPSKELSSDGLMDEQSSPTWGHAAAARHSILEFAEEQILNRSIRPSPQSPGKSTVSRLISIDDVDEDRLDSIMMLYGVGSESPLPQESCKDDIRPLDDGAQAAFKLGDVLSVRKVWGTKTAAALLNTQPGYPDSGARRQPLFHSPMSWNPSEDLVRSGGSLPKKAYPLVVVEHQWQHHSSLLTAHTHRTHASARGGMRRTCRVQLDRPLSSVPMIVAPPQPRRATAEGL